jgi:plasmid replication initiation protein
MSKLVETSLSYKRRKDNYQPNTLTLSRQEYTLNERKIVAFIINQIDHTQEYRGQNLSFQIPIQEISHHMDYKDIKKAALALQKKQIGYEIEETDEFEYITPFPRISYNKNKNGLLEVTIFNDVVPFFIELGKRYTRYSLEVFLSFDSIYAQKMYEILTMEYRQGKGRKAFKMTMVDLQNTLGSFYTDFYDFKRKVMVVAQKEIFDKADMVFEYNIARKEGKKVVELEFIIQSFVDIAFENVNEELQAFESVSTEQAYLVARNLLEVNYTFKPDQIEHILNTPQKLALFVETNSKIEQGIIEIKSTPTKYMATVLGFSKY